MHLSSFSYARLPDTHACRVPGREFTSNMRGDTG